MATSPALKMAIGFSATIVFFVYFIVYNHISFLETLGIFALLGATMMTICKYHLLQQCKSFANYRPAVMVVLGPGGHTWEMLQILSKLDWKSYLPIYITSSEPSDQHSSLHALAYFERQFNRKYFQEKIKRPRPPMNKVWFQYLRIFLRSLSSFFQSVRLLILYKPDYLLANGPNLCVPIVLAGWTLKKLSILSNLRIIYVESAARTNTLSVSAQIVKPFCDQMFAFWPELAKTHLLRPLLKDLDFSCNPTIPNQILKFQDQVVFITVGTTNFDDLVNFTIEDEQFHQTLLEFGFTSVILQVGLSTTTIRQHTAYSTAHLNSNSKSKLNIRIVNVVGQETFETFLRQANLVICHGGAATVLQAIQLGMGSRTIVVPNPAVRENHQVELLSRLHNDLLIHVAPTVDKLVETVRAVLANAKTGQELEGQGQTLQMTMSQEFISEIGQAKLTTMKTQDNNDAQIDDDTNVQTQTQFSIVIPTLLKDRAQLVTLLTSLHHFVHLESLAKIFIIVPQDQHSEFEAFVEFPFTWNKLAFIPETELVPDKILSKCDSFLFNFQSRTTGGWFKQQILKLKAADLVPTKFYLILDSDCILTRSLCYSDIVETTTTTMQKNDGHRAHVRPRARAHAYLQTEGIHKHPNWWAGSAKILGICKPYLDSLQEGIGVTPQVLSVQIVKKLANFLEESHKGSDWCSILASNTIQLFPELRINGAMFRVYNWTEYTLYYLFAKRSGLLDRYHVESSDKDLANYAQSVWQIQEAYEWNPYRNQLQLPASISQAPFVIFQSNLRMGSRLPSAFFEQFDQICSKDKFANITCLMRLSCNDENLLRIQESIRCFLNQSWPKNKLELLIIYDDSFRKEASSRTQTRSKLEQMLPDEMTAGGLIRIMDNKTFDSRQFDRCRCEKTTKFEDDTIGEFVAIWAPDCWYSPFRLAVQFNFLKENMHQMSACLVSPYVQQGSQPDEFYLQKCKNEVQVGGGGLSEISLFCTRNYYDKLGQNGCQDDISAVLAQPNLIIRAFCSDFDKQKVQAKGNSSGRDQIYTSDASHISELRRLICPFQGRDIFRAGFDWPMKQERQPLSIRRRRIYIVSSELAFTPMIGGINTFLRVIISSIPEIQHILVKNGVCGGGGCTDSGACVEFVFCGLECGDNTSDHLPPNLAKNAKVKSFPTNLSERVSSPEEYFKSFKKLSSIAADLKLFTAAAVQWIVSDAQPGDICVTTIVYEWNPTLLNKIRDRGLKIIHTVHSLVVLKTLATARCPPLNQMSARDNLKRLVLTHLFPLNEERLAFVASHSWSRWILPKFLNEAISTEKYLMQISHSIFVPSRKLAATTVSLFPDARHKIRYVPWGLPASGGPVLGEHVHVAAPAAAHAPMSESESQLPQGSVFEDGFGATSGRQINCLALCKIIPQKGIDLLLDSLSLIEKMDPSLAARIHLNICGDMSYVAENQYLLKIKQKANSLNQIKVHFTGWLSGQPKADLMSRSDIFVLPSLVEPFGFSVLEAMKSGMAIVSFATEGPLDLISSEFGTLVPLSEDVDEMVLNFAGALADVCSCAERLEKMKMAAVEHANRWNMNAFFTNLLTTV